MHRHYQFHPKPSAGTDRKLKQTSESDMNSVSHGDKDVEFVCRVEMEKRQTEISDMHFP